MYDAQGTKLFIGDVGSPEAFSQVLKVRRISPPGLSRPNWKDRTDLDADPDTGARTGKPGLIETGEGSVEVFWVPDDALTHEAMLSAFLNNTKKRFRIQWPDDDASYMDFDGFITGPGSDPQEVDGDLVRTFTFRATGLPVFGS